MTFKNNRGEVPWYVIGLILAIIVLLVSLGAVNKIRDAQKGTTDQANACTILGGQCGSCADPLVLGNPSCSGDEVCCPT